MSQPLQTYGNRFSLLHSYGSNFSHFLLQFIFLLSIVYLNNCIGTDTSVICAYQPGGVPPVLYGASIPANRPLDQDTTQSIYPLDVAAPGTVKIFTSKSDAIAQINAFQHENVFYWEDGILYKMPPSSQNGVPLYNTSVLKVTTGGPTRYVVTNKAGNHVTKSISLQDDHGNDLSVFGEH